MRRIPKMIENLWLKGRLLGSKVINDKDVTQTCMNKKTKRFILLGIFICLIGHFVFISNVFDSIYYSRIKGLSKMLSTVSLKNMPQLSVVDYEQEGYFKSEGLYVEKYMDKYLGDVASLRIAIVEKSKLLEISYTYEDEGNIEAYTYIYDVRKKTLTYRALLYEGDDIYGTEIQNEDTERKNYLYDGFLKDWFSANKFRTRFSLNHLGIFKYTRL